MKLLTVITIFVFQVLSNDGPLVRELPPGGAEELLQILRREAFNSSSGCDDLTESDITLYLFTRESPKTATILNRINPEEIDPDKKIIVIIHGWMASATSSGIPELKDAYLQRYDANVVVVDWYKLAWRRPSTSLCYLPKIVDFVSDFFCILSEQKTVPLDAVHVLGHSMGAQITGLVGQETMRKCSQKLGRITALDPAGFTFQNAPRNKRLDESDAKFVDVIHTNEGMLGYFGNCGTVDFYVNCGTHQPGCPQAGFSFQNVLNVPISIITCSHLRALEYMAESVNSPNFKAKRCENCPAACLLSLFQQSDAIMGENCPKSLKGGYLVTTGPFPPYSGSALNLLR